APAIENDQPRERGQFVVEVAEVRVDETRDETAHDSRDAHDIERTLTTHLVRDAHTIRIGIPNSRKDRSHRLPSSEASSTRTTAPLAHARLPALASLVRMPYRDSAERLAPTALRGQVSPKP